MPEQDNLPAPAELANALLRVVESQRPETLHNSDGAPVAIIVPVAKASQQTAREQFMHQLRAWRLGDPEEQRQEWKQLEEVLQEGIRLGTTP